MCCSRSGIVFVAKKVLTNPTVRALARKGLDYALGIYYNVTKRIKNKKAQIVLKKHKIYVQ